MTETVGAFAVGVIGLVVLCFASVVLAIKTEGDRSISWSGFGVVFQLWEHPLVDDQDSDDRWAQ